MEIGKIERIDLTNIRIHNSTATPLRVKMEGIQPGEAFVVSGIERTSISHLLRLLKPKVFVTRKVTIGSYRVIRVS